jgi:hypothetical protein
VTSIVIAAILAALFAGLLVLRIRYGELRVSELPVLLLALLAGSEERGRLGLILSHREAARPARRETEREVTARWERDKEAPGPVNLAPWHKEWAKTRAAHQDGECDGCAIPLGTGVRYHDTAGNHWCPACERGDYS